MRIDRLKINEDIYKLGNDAIIEGYYRRYPTLSTPPTLQTLTYTLDGETLTYDIGAVVRVEDADSLTGYSFYRLHNITNLGNAVWSKLGNGLLELYETVTVDIISNQGAVDQNLIGVQVVIKYGNTLLTQTYSGEPMLFYIPAGSTYSIYAVNNVPAGYGINYSSSNYTAVSWGARRLEITCGVEVVSITVDGYPVMLLTGAYDPETYVYQYKNSASNSNLPNAVIIIDGLRYYLKDKMNSSTNTVNIPLNSNYTIYLPPFSYYSRGHIVYRYVSSSGQCTATNASRTVNIATLDLNDGIYILRDNCIFYEPDEWDTDWNDEAIGVAIIHAEDTSLFNSFLIKKDDVSLPCMFDSLYELRVLDQDLIPNDYDQTSYSASTGAEAIVLEYTDHDYPYIWFFTETEWRNGKYKPAERYTILDCIDILNNDPTAVFAVELNQMADSTYISSTNWDERVYQGYEAIRNCVLKDVLEVDGVMYGTPRYLLVGGYISNESPYIGTMAQWQYMFDNQSYIEDAMSMIGGNEIRPMFGSAYLWSMTPFYNQSNLLYMWGAAYAYVRNNSYQVHDTNDRGPKNVSDEYVRSFYSLIM